MNLESLGWTPHFKQHYESMSHTGTEPARVVRQDRSSYTALFTGGELSATITGKYRHEIQPSAGLPAVGDWVVLTPDPSGASAVIHKVLPRRSAFSRVEVGGATKEQVVAANIDTVFLVSGLDGDFNVRRIERYVTLAWDSGATPVVLLNKADLCSDLSARIAEVESVAPGVDVHPLTAADREGIEMLDVYLAEGRTVALAGSSGVGKSTIVNALLHADRMVTRPVRQDDSRGRHTTSHRELILLPNGGMIIDTPGMRELQLWATEDSLAGAFGDIEELIQSCRFADCGHDSEPGCAIRGAIEDGSLDRARYASYQKLKRELAHLARRQSDTAEYEQRQRGKKFNKMYKSRQKMKRDGW